MASNSATINLDIIKRTKGSLGALITKPALTDKLLSKPPFRFLHDILTEILRNTGFLHGLFTEEEMNSENVKDKDKKVLFLQKVIDVLMFATGQKLKVKPSRIVAGAEAEKTNEMLQLVAYCVQKKIDSSEAVRRVLGGEKPFSQPDKTEDKAKPKEKETKGSESELAPVSSRVKLPENDPDRQRGAEADRKRRGDRARRERRDPSEEERGKKRDPSEEERGKKRDPSEEERGKKRDPSEEERGKKRDPSEEKVRRREVSEERLKRGTSRDGRRPPAPEQPPQRDPSPPPERAGLPDGPESSPPNPRQRPASAKRSRRHEPEYLPEPGTLPPNNSHISMGEGEPNPPPNAAADAGSSDNEQDMEAPPPMMSRPPIRPSTARRAPPKRRDSSLEGTERILSGKKEGPKVYLDSELDRDDTEEQFIVQDTAETLALSADRDLEDEEGQQGALTKKLFETKKHLEGDLVQEGEQGVVNEAQRYKQKEVAQKEIGQMQQAIQSVCQNVSPLSKIIDFVHEDLESMRNELEKWRKESSKHSAALLKEEAAIEEGLLPLKEQMEKLETQMMEARENIRTSRYNYYQNEDRIKKLIEGISFASQQ